MGSIIRNTSKGQLVALGPYMQSAVAASQSNVDLPLVEANGTDSGSDTVTVTSAAKGVVVPFGGAIVGIGWSLSAAGSAGSLTIGATIGGTENAGTTQTITTATSGYASFSRGAVPVSAGDSVGVEITTNASWNGTTADLAVTVYALLQLEDI